MAEAKTSEDYFLEACILVRRGPMPEVWFDWVEPEVIFVVPVFLQRRKEAIVEEIKSVGDRRRRIIIFWKFEAGFGGFVGFFVPGDP